MIRLIFTIALIILVLYAWSHPVIPTSQGKVTLESIVTPLIEHHKVSVTCTEEAKMCPDGSSVGRVGPMCEFAKCPGE